MKETFIEIPQHGARKRPLSGIFEVWSDVWIRSGWRVQTHFADSANRVLEPRGTEVFRGGFDDCVEAARTGAPAAGRRKGVVLLHGLGHHPGAMAVTAGILETLGWSVANVGYPSLKMRLEDHADAASAVARALSEDGADNVSFVGHSLGGLVARSAMALAARDGWNPGRLVLVGSPARGAAFARFASRLPGYHRIFGACGKSVTFEGAASVPLPTFGDIGIIAGGTGGIGYNPLLHGDNDGTVTVSETRLPEIETAFKLVRCRHTPLARHRDATTATAAFLETGRMPT